MNISVSDVDRGVYESLELRVAQHPSESVSYLWTRVLAYCLSYEEGIRFSKGGLSTADEAPLAIWGDDGTLKTWIDVGSPSADRLHKASKAADNVVLYSAVNIGLLRKEASRKRVHQLEAIDVWQLPPALLKALEANTKRQMTVEIVRTENQLYATVNGDVTEAQLTQTRLVDES